MEKNDRAPSLRGIAIHPVEFPEHNSVIVTEKNVVKKILDKLQNYQTREFRLAYVHYGLEASVNYEYGKFISMIQKGSGIEGERIDDETALKLVPEEIEYKGGAVTLHVMLSIKWDERVINPSLAKHEIPKILRNALHKGEIVLEDAEITCRVGRVYINGNRADSWRTAKKAVTGFILIYDLLFSYEQTEEWVKDMLNDVNTYHLPTHGIVVTDEHIGDPEAFPETHFIFQEKS